MGQSEALLKAPAGCVTHSNVRQCMCVLFMCVSTQWSYLNAQQCSRVFCVLLLAHKCSSDATNNASNGSRGTSRLGGGIAHLSAAKHLQMQMQSVAAHAPWQSVW